MAIRKVGSRRIVVDGVAYRWRIPPRSTYRQECFRFPLLGFIWREDRPNSVLELHGGNRPDHALGLPPDIVTPRRIALGIRAALKQGWNPERAGAAYMELLAIKTEAT